MTFGAEKLEWFGYLTMKNFWRYDYSYWQNSRTWRTDGRTDTQTDNAWRHRPRLHSIARKKLTTGTNPYSWPCPTGVVNITSTLSTGRQGQSTLLAGTTPVLSATRRGLDPHRPPTRRAIFFENWPTGTLSAGRQGRCGVYPRRCPTRRNSLHITQNASSLQKKT